MQPVDRHEGKNDDVNLLKTHSGLGGALGVIEITGEINSHILMETRINHREIKQKYRAH